jgi:hypothetical protein
MLFPDIYARAAAAWLFLPLLAAVPAQSQTHFAQRDKSRGYQVTKIYDKETDSTRVTFTVLGSSRPFGLKSRAWIDLSFTYPGRRLTSPPQVVFLTLESFTPSRGGWAFARPQELRIACADAEKLRLAPVRYQKLTVHLFDSGRREVLSFRIPASQIVTLAGEELLNVEAGRAKLRFRERRMAMLRQLVAMMTPSRMAGEPE